MTFGKLQVDQIETSTKLYNVDQFVTSDGIGETTASLLEQFRDSRKIYVSLDGDDENDGTSIAEPLRTLRAASLQAEPGDVVFVSPGTYIEDILPIRWKYDVTIFGSGLRSTIVQPAPGQEFNDIFKVDSGFWCWGLSFAGHQADETRQAWAIDFDELADNRHRGAISLGAHIFKSPYIQNCTSITAEDDRGLAGSNSTGNTGGGIRVDGSKCSINSPIRSMVVDSYTQVNLGGPGCLVLNDGYAQLVSFFGTFCTYHVRTETGGQVNLSGGGTTDFGLYGLMADGYSRSPLFTGSARTSVFGAIRLEKTFTVDLDTDTFSCVNHELVVNDQVTVKATQGVLPTGLEDNTIYYVVEEGLTADTFKLSISKNGLALDLTGVSDGTYQFLRQGVTEIDVIDLGPNRLGRQIKYPVQGSLGSSGNPISVFNVDEGKFYVTLGTTDILHEYVGGGKVILGENEYPITSATYDGTSGVAILTASGYVPQVGDSVSLSGLSFICNSASRPNAGQLMFPEIVFPRNSSTGLPEEKTFSYTRIDGFTFTYIEDSFDPDGPDYEYVGSGTATIDGTDYKIIGADYNKTTGLVTIKTSSQLPLGDGDVTIDGIRFISSAIAYVITSSIPIDVNGNEVDNTDPSRAGYRVVFFSGLNGGLKEPIHLGQTLDFRNRSQISAPSHTFEFVGSGMNYDALPWNGGVPIEGNAIVETNNGRVYSSNTNERGDFKVGSQFSVDGTSGSVTINTDQFNLSGLNFIGPFSRNGGISTVGEQLREVSNNTSLIASIGGPDSNTVPSQFAVKTYTDNKFLTDISVTGDLPLTITDTSEQDNQGYWIRSRNIELSINEPDGLARLDGSGLVPSSLLPSYVDDVLEYADFDSLPETGETGKIYVSLDNGKTYRWGGSAYVEISSRPPSTDEVPEGLTNLYFTESRARNSLSVSGTNGLSYDSETGSFSFDFPETGVEANTYNLATVTVDSSGRITSAESGSVSLSDNTDVDISSNPPVDRQALTYNEASGQWVPGNVEPGGDNTQIQFNKDGDLSGSADLTWDDTTKELGVSGGIRFDGNEEFSTSLQMVPATENHIISFPNATGTIALVSGINGQLIYNNNGAFSGTRLISLDEDLISISGRVTNSYNSTTGSSPAQLFSGSWFSGGSSTTTKPHVLIEPEGTASESWGTNGTGLGVNAPSGFSGNLLDLQVNGTSKFSVNSSGIGRISTLYVNQIGESYNNTGGACSVIEAPFSGFNVSINTQRILTINTSTIRVQSDHGIGWSASASDSNSGISSAFFLDSTGRVAQRNGTNAQTFRCYGTYTDASNYVRAALSSTSTAVTLAAETSGTGADDVPLNLTASGSAPVNVNNNLDVGGDITLDDGGTFATTLQMVTPTQDRVISFPDATGTVGLVAGSSGNLVFNSAGSYAGVNGSVVDSTGNITISTRLSISTAGDFSNPPLRLTGTWSSGGTATTTKPQVLIEPSGASSSAWNTNGTGLGVNSLSSFNGNLLDLQFNGVSRFRVSSSGAITGNIASTTQSGLAPATSFSSITYSSTVNLDLSSLHGQYRTINLTGDLTLTSSGQAAGRQVVIRLITDSTSRNLTFPADWVFVSEKPASIAAGKSAILSLTFFGTNNSDCIAAYAVQP